MILDLPDNFTYVKNGQKQAYVSNPFMYIKSSASFRKIMYDATYAYRGRKRCYYCGGICSKDEITLDHEYPQSLGGPTITSNLRPVCAVCNEEKSNMTREEFIIYRGLRTDDKLAFWTKHLERTELIKVEKGFLLPDEWVKHVNINNIATPQCIKETGCKFKMVEYHFRTFHNFPKPLILDKNYRIVDNYNIFRIAKKYAIQLIPCVILENLIVIDKKNNS